MPAMAAAIAAACGAVAGMSRERSASLRRNSTGTRRTPRVPRIASPRAARLRAAADVPPAWVDVIDGGRACGERAQGHELARAEARHAARERLVAGGRDAEHGLGALAARRREPAARTGGERGRKHRAHRVGEPAAVRLGDPAAQRELPPREQRDRMHEPVERLELAVRGYVERDDDAVDGPRAEAGAHEMADPDIEARLGRDT